MIRKRFFRALLCVIIPLTMATQFLPEFAVEGYFSEEETALLGEITKQLKLEHGFSYDMSLDYITYASKKNMIINLTDQKFFEMINGSDFQVVKSLHLKLYRLFRQTECQTNQYKKVDQRTFNKISSWYLIPLKDLTFGIEDALYRKDSFFKSDVHPRKAAIDREEKMICLGTQEENAFFNAAEREILEVTLQTIDFDYGNDTEIDIAYVFSFSHSEIVPPQKERDLQKALSKYDADTTIEFYEKVCRLMAITEYKMEDYKTKMKWKFYTYMSKKLLPPLKTYVAILEKGMLQTNPRMKDALAEKQAKTKTWLEETYKTKRVIIDTF